MTFLDFLDRQCYLSEQTGRRLDISVCSLFGQFLDGLLVVGNQRGLGDLTGTCQRHTSVDNGCVALNGVVQAQTDI